MKEEFASERDYSVFKTVIHLEKWFCSVCQVNFCKIKCYKHVHVLPWGGVGSQPGGGGGEFVVPLKPSYNLFIRCKSDGMPFEDFRGQDRAFNCPQSGANGKKAYLTSLTCSTEHC